MSISLWLAASGLFWAPLHVVCHPHRIATCKSGEEGTVPTQIYDMQAVGTVRIECPEGTDVTNPATRDVRTGGMAVVYSENSDEKHTLLKDLLPGATYIHTDDESDLAVSQMPEQATTVYFRCGALGQMACWIGVRVAAAKPLESRQTPVKESEVTLRVTAPSQQLQFVAAESRQTPVKESEVTLRVTAPSQQLQFACPEPGKLLPEGDDTYEENCTTKVPLASVVPGATLTRATQTGDMNVFAVTTLPEVARVICYVCAVTTDAQPEKKSSVKIHVSKSNSSGCEMRVEVTAAIASAFGIPLAATVLGRYI